MPSSSLYTPLPIEDALRLITVRPGPFFADLEGDLETVAFSAKPRYMALSYTWGPSTADHWQFPTAFVQKDDGDWTHAVPGPSPSGSSETPSHEETAAAAVIQINGTSVAIGQNLALALRYLRSPAYPLTLWVDFVCINQADVRERNAQVAIMSWIYSRATAVVTWLGISAQTWRRAGNWEREQQQQLPTADPQHLLGGREMEVAYNMGNSKDLARWYLEHLTHSSSVARRNILEMRRVDEDELESVEAANRLLDSAVMKSDYWQRMWVVQEVCLAAKVFFVYGPTVFVSEEAVRSAHERLNLKVARGMEKIFEARRLRHFEESRLERLVEEFMAQKCADPRDKIYGLAGLANDIEIVEDDAEDDVEDDAEDDAEDYAEDDAAEDGDWSSMATTQYYNGSQNVELTVDYRRTYYEIWCDIVQYLFRCPYYFVPPHLDTDESELRRLRHVRLTNVVRFAGIVQNTLQDEVEGELAQIGTAEAASPPETMEVRLRGPRLFGRHVVPARGYLAGKILELGPTYAQYVGSRRCQTAWRALWRKHYRKESDLVTLRAMEERYATKILLYSEADVGRIARLEADSFVAYPTLEAEMLDHLTVADTTDTDKLQIIEGLLEKISHHTVFDDPSTGEGEACRFIGTEYCMGVAPPGTAVGDWVVRFWNCDTAVVVRPLNDGDETDPGTVLGLVGRADVADTADRKGPQGDTFGSQALQRDYFDAYAPSKIVDMVMDWRTLQRVTASITT